MEVIHGINRIKKFPQPVAALGVFDGVHHGHRMILQAAVKRARAIGGTSMVVTFWPHPQHKESLYSLEHRLSLFAEMGIRVCIVVHFTPGLARMPAAVFVRAILVRRLGVKAVYVGENFRFGKNAGGTVDSLRVCGKEYGFSVHAFKVRTWAGRIISSTTIRALIRQGDLRAARRLLGRRVSVLGTVIKGSRFGRRLGCATANIAPHHEVTPPAGVYAVQALYQGRRLYGACYIGAKPALTRSGRLMLTRRHTIEVHLFHFHRRIYGQTLEIQFVKKLRDPAHFTSPALLAAQIKKDTLAIRRYFSLP